ncbi:hypothetical protein QMK28_11040 [Streptomyces sp. H27-D2]|nr:hypothetical protein [Streptomyces sp. H27-D2]MEC4016833.1 hypothetical protein [Streptomyces sp. H27-D2]
MLTAASAPAAALAPASAPALVAAEGDSPDGFTIKDSRITESSGLAASRAHPGVYWTHNDSDDGPYIYAVDGKTGRTVATVTLRGIGAPRDVEAISVGPDGDVYVGDIGDNLGGTWPHVWIYRFPEPKRLADSTVTATQYVVRYEGGARDAESLMVHPKTGRVYIVSKKRDGGGALYEGPAQLSKSGTNTFRRAAGIDVWATDAAFSPDGSRLAVRSYFGGRMYAWKDGRPKERDSLSVPIQRQGESVSFTSDGKALMFGSEGARSSVEPVEVEAGDQGGAGGSKGGDGSPSDSGSAGADGGKNRTLTLGAITFVVATALVMGLRRLLRRGRS